MTCDDIFCSDGWRDDGGDKEEDEERHPGGYVHQEFDVSINQKSINISIIQLSIRNVTYLSIRNQSISRLSSCQSEILPIYQSKIDQYIDYLAVHQEFDVSINQKSINISII